MKEQLCRAFCDELVIRRLPSGIDAVDTAFSTSDGDSIGFFLKEIAPDSFEIRDAGITLPSLVAGGLDLKNPTRKEAFAALLNEYGVAVDEDEQEFAISGVDSATLPKAALRFVSFMLRVGDLLLLAEERAASTFLTAARGSTG